MAIHYKAWITGNFTKKSGWLLQETELNSKKGVTKKNHRQVSRYDKKLQEYKENC